MLTILEHIEDVKVRHDGIVMSFAMTDASKKQIKEMTPYLSEMVLLTKLRETSEGKNMIEKCGNPPVVALNGITELLQIAEKGGCLSVEELLAMEKALTAVSRMKQYLKRGMVYQIPLAFIIPKKGTDVNKLRKEIMKVCEEQLPTYSYPAEIIFKETFPYTSAAKVDYRALEDEANREDVV